MKLTGLLLILLVSSNPAKALDASWHETTCSALEEETRQAFAGSDFDNFAAFAGFGAKSPSGTFLQQAFADLSEAARERVVEPVSGLFIRICLFPEPGTVHEDMTVTQAFDMALQRLRLDRRKPDWNLVTLPKIDMTKDSCQTFIQIFAGWREPLKSLPVNDIYRIQLNRFSAKYDLSDPAAAAEFQALPLAIAINAQDTKDEPCFDVMERLLAEKGVLPQ